METHERARKQLAETLLLNLIGEEGSEARARARRVDVKALSQDIRDVAQRSVRIQNDLAQIELDLARQPGPHSRQRTLLLAWLSLHPAGGYAQGYNFVATALTRIFCAEEEFALQHAFGCMHSMLKVYSCLTPHSSADERPLQSAELVAALLRLEVLRVGKIREAFMSEDGISLIKAMILNMLPTLFTNTFTRDAVLWQVWNYVFATPNLSVSAARLRRVLGACLLRYEELFYDLDIVSSLSLFSKLLPHCSAHEMSVNVQIANTL